MDFAFDERTRDLIDRMQGFMDEVVHPAEPVAHEQIEANYANDTWTPPAVIEDLKAEAKQRGLWNLFLPSERGAGLTNLQYAPLA